MHGTHFKCIFLYFSSQWFAPILQVHSKLGFYFELRAVESESFAGYTDASMACSSSLSAWARLLFVSAYSKCVLTDASCLCPEASSLNPITTSSHTPKSASREALFCLIAQIMSDALPGTCSHQRALNRGTWRIKSICLNVLWSN